MQNEGELVKCRADYEAKLSASQARAEAALSVVVPGVTACNPAPTSGVPTTENTTEFLSTSGVETGGSGQVVESNTQDGAEESREGEQVSLGGDEVASAAPIATSSSGAGETTGVARDDLAPESNNDKGA